MKVTRKITFNEYWLSGEFHDKRPVRNGSQRMMVGDNIYYKDPENGLWHQAHSHHSMPDGSPNTHNLKRDTQSEFVLISQHFYYFGRNAPIIPEDLLGNIGYKNGRSYRVFECSDAAALPNWIENNHRDDLNLLSGDPYDFNNSEAHYSVHNNSVTKISRIN